MMSQPARDYGALTEADLVALARGHDPMAFRAIMQRFNQRLFRVARAVMGNDDEAEDVLQAAYLSAFRGIAAFRGDAHLLTWLTTITLNEARGRLRRRRPTLELTMLDRESPGVVPFPGMTPVSNPEAEAGRAEVRAILEAAVDALPTDFRIVFMLREVDGYSTEEAAAHLSIPEATVKTRLFRARRLLREGLEKQFLAGLSGVFPFLGKRCDTICENVLRELE
jgi:RNA polymerase sigma-70 factor (ECF subfamily)